MGRGTVRSLVAWVVLSASLAACQSEPSCLELTEIELSTLGLSGLAQVDLGPDGLMLLHDSSTYELVVSQLRRESELVQLARIPGDSSGLLVLEPLGQITQDPDSGVIWVVQLDHEGPDRFYKFNAAGEALADGTLVPSDEIDITRQIMIDDGELIRIAVRDTAPHRIDWEMSLERFSATGELRWSRLIDYPEVADRAATFTGAPIAIEGILAFTSYRSGIDSSAVDLLAVDPTDGQLVWHRSLTNDDFGGAGFGISTDDDGRLLLTVKRPAISNFDPETGAASVVSPSRSIIEVLAADGTTLSSHTTEWPGFVELFVPAPVSSNGDLVQIAFGEGLDYGPRTVLARLSGDGELLCRSPIGDLGEDATARLTKAEDGRVLVYVGDGWGRWQRLFAVEGL